jgi:hypothetical protein
MPQELGEVDMGNKLPHQLSLPIANSPNLTTSLRILEAQQPPTKKTNNQSPIPALRRKSPPLQLQPKAQPLEDQEHNTKKALSPAVPLVLKLLSRYFTWPLGIYTV